MNLKFFELPIEKQNRMLNAGYKVFALYPYKKAPMSVIADEAGISKPLLFHYFYNKKGLYLHLFTRAVAFAEEESKKDHMEDEKDYFVLMRKVIEQRIRMIKKYPYMYRFLANAYYEKSDLVQDDLARIKSEKLLVRKEDTLKRIDCSKFKNPEDVGMLFDIVLWMSEGYMLGHMDSAFIKSGSILSDTQRIFEVLQRNFYKDELEEGFDDGEA